MVWSTRTAHAASSSLRHEQVAETLADLLSVLRVVSITGDLKVVSSDPDDDKVLECAVVGAATHIVSGDRRHLLPLRSHAGISIMSPSAFVQLQDEAS